MRTARSIALTCSECAAEFTFWWINGSPPKTCSRPCKTARQARLRLAPEHPRGNRPCLMCGTDFEPRGTRSDGKYCGNRCNSLASRLRVMYGIDEATYRQMMEAQQGSCAACGKPFGDDTPYVDHSHVTGRVRGLIHANCNSALGFLGDDANSLLRVATYLARHDFDLRELCAR